MDVNPVITVSSGPCTVLTDFFNIYKKQDKVNYTVSEREYRVTDFTTLTRMTGCAEMYWAATGLYRAVMGCARLHSAVLSCTAL